MCVVWLFGKVFKAQHLDLDAPPPDRPTSATIDPALMSRLNAFKTVYKPKAASYIYIILQCTHL